MNDNLALVLVLLMCAGSLVIAWLGAAELKRAEAQGRVKWPVVVAVFAGAVVATGWFKVFADYIGLGLLALPAAVTMWVALVALTAGWTTVDRWKKRGREPYSGGKLGTKPDGDGLSKE